MAVGSHSVTVFAEDAAGNMGASETLFFTVEEPAELSELFPTTLVAAAASIITVAVFAVFLFYMRKHKN